MSAHKPSLEDLDSQGRLRRLTPQRGDLVDLSSNDYLGLASQQVSLSGRRGAGGSRLLTGNSQEVIVAEQRIASFFGFPSAVLFSSTFLANLAWPMAWLSRDVKVAFDAHCHASIREGLRLANARQVKFPHNDLQKLQDSGAPDFLVVESVYSMSGEHVPVELVREFSASNSSRSVVDEAHSVGVFGPNGEGMFHAEDVFAKVVSFGKAFGFQGGAVLCDEHAKQAIVNHARSFIYTTGVSPVVANATVDALAQVESAGEARTRLAMLMELAKELGWSGSGPVFFHRAADSAGAVELAKRCQDAGFWVMPVRQPTVPEGQEGVRISVHAFNTEEELKGLNKILGHG